METKDVSTRLIDMTLGEALDIAKPYLEKIVAQVVRDNLAGKGADEWGIGLKAICEVFGCGTSKAVEYHNDKRYQAAYCDDSKKRFSVNKTLLRKLRQEEQAKRIKKGLV
ncbi:MAG: hypothetical protein J5621_00820 [Paludibacteraceae bacterium]|nr:hypothetical protein [Paludibacteraceae bacterium]